MHNLYSPYPFHYDLGFMLGLMSLVLVLALAVIALKGYALWHAARAGQKGWFVALLVVNTLGILEVVYLVWFRPKSEALAETPPEVSSSAPVK